MTKKRNVLLVEDDAGNREALANILINRECNVTTVENYDDAMTKIEEYHADEEKRFHVLLTDIILTKPGLGGDELIKTVKRFWPEMGIVAISGAREKCGHCCELGANAFLSKPLNVEDVYFAIDHAMLGRKHQADLH